MRNSRKNVTTRLTGLYPLQGKPEEKIKTLERIVEKLDARVTSDSEMIRSLYRQLQDLQSDVYKTRKDEVYEDEVGTYWQTDGKGNLIPKY